MTNQTAEKLSPEAAAKIAVAQINQVVAGKRGEQTLEASAETLTSVARLLTALTEKLDAANTRATRLENGMRRIANLEIRNAAGLIEQERWKEVVEEVQALAQDVNRR